MKGKFTNFLLFFVLVPFGLSFISFYVFELGGVFEKYLIFPLLPFIIGGMIAGFLAGKSSIKQNCFSEHFLIFIMPIAYTAVIWAIFMLLSGGNDVDENWINYYVFHAPFFLALSATGKMPLLLFAPLSYELAFLGGVNIPMLKMKERTKLSKKLMLAVLVIFFLAMVIGTSVHMQYKNSDESSVSVGFQDNRL